MPHYRNGREAKLGDIVLAKDFQDMPGVGVVTKIIPGTDCCNLIVAPIGHYTLTLDAKNAIRADDALSGAQTYSVPPGPPIVSVIDAPQADQAL